MLISTKECENWRTCFQPESKLCTVDRLSIHDTISPYSVYFIW